MKTSSDREPISVRIAAFLPTLLGIGFLLMGLMLTIGGWLSGPHILFPGLVLLMLSYGMIGSTSRLNRKTPGCVRVAIAWSLAVVAVFGVLNGFALRDTDKLAIV